MKSVKWLAGLVIVACTVFAAAQQVPPGTDAEIRERLAPFGQVCRTGEECGEVASASANGARSGQQVYDQFCTACHATGVAGAPLLGDAAAWAPRIDQGMDTLWEHTLNGLNAMPPKGTCMNCSDEELRGVLDYMVAEAE